MTAAVTALVCDRSRLHDCCSSIPVTLNCAEVCWIAIPPCAHTLDLDLDLDPTQGKARRDEALWLGLTIGRCL